MRIPLQLSANTSSDYQLKCGMLNDMLDIIDVENKYDSHNALLVKYERLTRLPQETWPGGRPHGRLRSRLP